STLVRLRRWNMKSANAKVEWLRAKCPTPPREAILTDEENPPSCTPAMKRPKRRILLFRWLGDFVLCLLVAMPLSIPAAIMSRPEGGAYPALWVFWASTLAASCGMG